MNIVHFAPFGPNACGLYEAARDMIAADRQVGHTSELVDTGAVINGEYVNGQGKVGQEDNRGRTFISTEAPVIARNADVLIAHTGLPDPWISTCQAPLIWILHGRPQACFRPEQFGGSNSYSLLANIAQWPRVKKMITFWPYHVPFWHNVVPDSKLEVFDCLPVDHARFSKNGPIHDYGVMGGDINVALADALREDVDLYEVVNGVLVFARNHHDVKFHFYGMEEPLRCWELIFNELRLLGALGEVWARRPNMEEVYRSVDIVLSPHRITTRVVAESLCCGTPVIAANGNEFATWTCDPGDPFDVARVIEQACSEYKHKTVTSDSFALQKYSQRMAGVFKQLNLEE